MESSRNQYDTYLSVEIIKTLRCGELIKYSPFCQHKMKMTNDTLTLYSIFDSKISKYKRRERDTEAN